MTLEHHHRRSSAGQFFMIILIMEAHRLCQGSKTGAWVSFHTSTVKGVELGSYE